MEGESTSSCATLQRAPSLASSFARGLSRRCPCGDEALDGCRGLHVLGPRCREKVERHVRRRFGPHRYGGRYAADVPDLIQDCYQRLLAPGGLDSFRPVDALEPAEAFGGWLWLVVCNHCNNKLKYLTRQPAAAKDELTSLTESREVTTPEQEFARTLIRELSEAAVARVAPTWRARGPMWSERFDVVVRLISEEETNTNRACERLGIDQGHLAVLKLKLNRRIRREWRKQIRDGLALEPGVAPELIELMIDREIEALFQAAYPANDLLASPASEPEEPESKS
jgi:hypothetical protein